MPAAVANRMFVVANTPGDVAAVCHVMWRPIFDTQPRQSVNPETSAAREFMKRDCQVTGGWCWRSGGVLLVQSRPGGSQDSEAKGCCQPTENQAEQHQPTRRRDIWAYKGNKQLFPKRSPEDPEAHCNYDEDDDKHHHAFQINVHS